LISFSPVPLFSFTPLPLYPFPTDSGRLPIYGSDLSSDGVFYA
jgi:hypothetical protein